MSQWIALLKTLREKEREKSEYVNWTLKICFIREGDCWFVRKFLPRLDFDFCFSEQNYISAAGFVNTASIWEANHTCFVFLWASSFHTILKRPPASPLLMQRRLAWTVSAECYIELIFPVWLPVFHIRFSKLVLFKPPQNINKQLTFCLVYCHSEIYPPWTVFVVLCGYFTR